MKGCKCSRRAANRVYFESRTRYRLWRALQGVEKAWE